MSKLLYLISHVNPVLTERLRRGLAPPFPNTTPKNILLSYFYLFVMIC